MYICKLLIVSFVMVCLQVQATVESEVLIMTDSPAFIEQVTAKQGVGTISSVYAILFDKIGLPEQLTLTPLNRQNRLLDQNVRPVCALYRFKSKERAQKYAFSQPIYFLLHYRLYQRASGEKLSNNMFTENGDILSLQAIHSQLPDAKFLYIPSYSYGDILNPQLQMLPDTSKVKLVGAMPHNKLSQLFFSGRAEFALMFPAEVKAYMEVNQGASYYSYTIANVPYVTKGYMMCNRMQASFDYIQRVNEAMSALYTTSEYLLAHTQPYNESEKQGIENALKELIEAYQ